MYYQVEQVLEKQKIETEKFYKGRGILICETSEGLFALKEFHGQMQKAEKLYQLGEFLTEKGIACDYIIKNKEDQLITEGIDGQKYTFHHWVKGRECDVRSRMDMVMTIAFLAKFHAVCEEQLYRKEHNFPEQENILEEYKRHDRELRRIRKYILNRKGKNDFEQLYLRNCPEYIRQSEEVLHFLALYQEKICQHTTGICHGDFNQHNVVIEAGKITMIHMEHARMEAQVSDVSNFLRKMMEKHEWSETLGLELLREYCRIHEMKEADWLELYCRLSYPEKFWKIANHYYHSSKVWNSEMNYEKLKKELEQNRARQRFLETLKRARL